MFVSTINSLKQSHLFTIEKTSDAEMRMAGNTSVECLIKSSQQNHSGSLELFYKQWLQ